MIPFTHPWGRGRWLRRGLRGRGSRSMFPSLRGARAASPGRTTSPPHPCPWSRSPRRAPSRTRWSARWRLKIRVGNWEKTKSSLFNFLAVPTFHGASLPYQIVFRVSYPLHTSYLNQFCCIWHTKPAVPGCACKLQKGVMENIGVKENHAKVLNFLSKN